MAFYWASDKLIVAVDGALHQNPTAMEYDEKRALFLRECSDYFDSITTIPAIFKIYEKNNLKGDCPIF